MHVNLMNACQLFIKIQHFTSIKTLRDLQFQKAYVEFAEKSIYSSITNETYYCENHEQEFCA